MREFIIKRSWHNLFRPAPRQGKLRLFYCERHLWAGAPLMMALVLCVLQLGTHNVQASNVGKLAGLWHMDHMSFGARTPDSSGHHNDGLLTGTAEVPGKYVKGLSFDGTAAFVRVPNSTTLEPASITVELWVNSANPGPNAYLLDKGATGCSYGSYSLNIASSGPGDLFFDIFSSGSGFQRSPSAPHAAVFDGHWHHVAGVFDGAKVRLYLDGIEQGSGTTATGTLIYNLTTTDDLFFGRFNGSCVLPFSGSLDEVRVWSRALAANEILADAQAGLRLDLHLNEKASVQSLADSSGYGNNGARGMTSAVEASDPGTVAGEAPYFGNALSFDGTSDFVTVAHGATLDFVNSTNQSVSGPYTLESWINVTDVNTFRPIFIRPGGAGDDIEVYVQPGSTDLVVFHNRNNGAANFDCVLYPTPPLNQLFHLAVTWDGNFHTYYNGVPQTADAAQTTAQCVNFPGYAAGTPAKVNGQGWWLGKATAFGPSFFKGTIDEVHFWARALSGQEVAYIANSATKGELILPSTIGQEIDDGDDFVYPTVYEAHDLDRSMGLDFIVSSDADATIDPPSGPFRGDFGCVTDKWGDGRDEERERTRGGLLGCTNGLAGGMVTSKAALFTSGESDFDHDHHERNEHHEHEDDRIIKLDLKTTEPSEHYDKDRLRFYVVH